MLRMVQHVFMPGDYVCKRGDVGKEIYMCSKGSVEIVIAGQTNPQLHEGAGFGEVACLVGLQRTASIRAVTVCELNVLPKDDLDDIFMEFPKYAIIMHDAAIMRSLHTLAKPRW